MIVFLQMATLLDSLPDAQCSFPDEVSTHIFLLIESIQNIFSGLNDWFSDAWMFSTFSVEGSVTGDSEVVTKVNFLIFREDSQLNIDFSEQELHAFWMKLKEDYPVLSIRALTMLLQSPSAYRCKTACSAMVTVKTKAHDTLVMAPT